MQPKPLTDDEILALVQAEYDAAEQWTDELEADRETALDYYYGRPMGDEVEGRSKVRSSDVADVIEWMMPGLIRVVAGDDTLVEFEGRDEIQSKLVTEAVRHVIDNENDGYRLKHDTIKDGLLSKTGAAKVTWTTRTEPIDRDYQNLGDMELALLIQGLQQPGIEVQIIGQEAIPQPDGSQRYNIRVRMIRAWGQVVVEPIPPEELLIPREAKVIDDSTRYVGHDCTTITRSDLVAQGVPLDVALELPRLEVETFEERFTRNGAGAYDDPAQNKMMERVEYVEHYVLADIDGDGIAERRLICTSGNKVLRNEVLSCLPVAVWTPFRVPHTAVGRSLADRVIDIQRVNTSLLRGMLDNVYTVNAGGRKVVVPGLVNMDDLLTMRPGGVIRAKDISAIRSEPVEYFADRVMQVAEYVRTIREERTGVNRHNQGINAESMHQTATGAMSVLEQGEELKEVIIRNYCEFFLKRIYRIVADYICRYQDEAMQIRVSGRLLTVDPMAFNDRYGLKVKVGAGNMRKRERIAALTNILQSQTEALMSGMPLTTIQQVYQATADLTELAGFNAERYWTSPEKIPQQPKQDKMDPLVEAEMIKANAKAQETAGRLQLQEAEAAAKLNIEREKMLREDARKYTELELRYSANVPGSRV